MRIRDLFFRTFHDDPADAEVPSHRLLARAGFIQKVTAGVYSYAPMFWRTIRKVMAVVKEEMDRAGALEVMLPVMQPLELWEESERLPVYLQSETLFHFEDRRGARLCLGPTHEEVVTDLVRRTLSSWRELPVTLWQQQVKFRDEIRPRFGLMRGREFIMKDAYSFDADDEGLDASYRRMSEAYHRIFRRLGLEYVVVDADSGAIGGSRSQEFMVTAATGEDELLMCRGCGYGANVEKAEARIAPAPPGGAPRPLRREPTPGIRTVEALVARFTMPAAAMAKTVIYEAVWKDEVKPVAVLMRGDRDVNEVKLTNHLGAITVRLAPDDVVRKVTGAEPGFAGPVGLAADVTLLADRSVEGMTNLLCGANATDVHCLDVNLGRDARMPAFVELLVARAGDGCPRCPGELSVIRGIEVGHVFKLGTKYSEKMKAGFTDRDGRWKPFVMGCYGLGSSRVAAAAVEQNHDADGIRWPVSVAPFHAVVMPATLKDQTQVAAAADLHDRLGAAGVEAVLDDRDAGMGVRLKDADLVGYPWRIVCGRSLARGQVELRDRRTGVTEDVPLTDIVERLAALVRSAGASVS